MAKFLVVSDIHIDSWMKFSVIDSVGRPSRLTDYAILAKDIGDTAIDEKCDAILIAGDISEKCVQRPSVLDIIGDFLRLLSEHVPVHLIPGNHDVDTKQSDIIEHHSILREICKDLSEKAVFYYSEDTKVTINNISVLFSPWNEDHIIPDQSADIFVGHGLVSGCCNLDNHIFTSGFSDEELFEKYRLSIVGDIHNGQVVDSDNMPGRKILIPGCPIQNSWRDAHNCGLWTVDVKGIEEEPVLKFFNIHDINPLTYHQFVYDQDSSELIHSRPTIRKTKSNSGIKGEAVKLERNLDDIYTTCLSIIDEDKVKNPNKIKEFVKIAFDNIKDSEDKVIAESTIKSVDIKNFLSIEELTLNFDEFPHSCVILGHNGSGKSSLPEAIYWCLTGNTTKEIPICDIPNTFKEDNTCSVSVALDVGTNKIEVSRKREGTCSTLSLLINGNVYKRGSIRDTQNEIFEILGLTDWQIKMFSYFSAQNTSLFAGLKESEKNNLLSQIIGLNFLESMRDYSKENKNELKDKILKSQGFISSIEFQITNLQSKLTKLSLELDQDSNEKIRQDITKLRNEISFANQELEETEEKVKTEFTELNEFYPKENNANEFKTTEDIQLLLSEYSTEVNTAQQKLNKDNTKKVSLQTELTKTKTEFKKANTGFCFTCEQPLKDEKVLLNLKTKIKDILKSIGGISSLVETEDRIIFLNKELDILSGAMSNIVKLNSTSSKKASEIKILESKLHEFSIELEKEKLDNSILEHINDEIKQADNEKLKHDGLLLEYSINQESWKYIETELLKKKGKLIKKLNEQGSSLIQQCIDEVLLDTAFNIKMSNDLKISGKFHNNVWMSYQSLSSGQKRVVDITLMVAMNNLFSKIYNLENGVLGLAVYDEILSFLDPEFIEASKNIIDQSISNKLLIITHDENLINMYDSQIRVNMSKTGSVYKKSWC